MTNCHNDEVVVVVVGNNHTPVPLGPVNVSEDTFILPHIHAHQLFILQC